MFRGFFLILLLGLCLLPVRAVTTSGTVVITTPDVTDWTTGWTTAGATGSNYIGTISGASGIYLGNGWVLTAAHVGAGTFTLGGVSYAMAAGSTQFITGSSGTVDLTLFQITGTGTLALNPLILSTDAPVAFASSDSPSQTVILGYGGSTSLSWGYNTVDLIDQSITLTGTPAYMSNDFVTFLGTVNNGSTVSTNNSMLISGDSGGGDFIYDSTRNEWILAGVNEGIGTTTGSAPLSYSAFVQLSTYADQISDITGVTAVPEPSTWLLLGVGIVLLCLWGHSRRAR